MRLILLGAVLALWGGAAHAQSQTLVDMATISMSAPGVPRTVTNTVCASDGNDLVCDRGIYVTPAGQLGVGLAEVSPGVALQVSGALAIHSNATTTGEPLIQYRYPGSSGINILGYKSGGGPWLGGLPYVYIKSVVTNAEPVARFTTSIVSSSNNIFGLLDLKAIADTMPALRTSGTVYIGKQTGVMGAEIIATTSTTLHVAGSMRLGVEASATMAVCDANRTGAIRYTGGDFSFCRNGSAWETLTSLGGGGGLSDRIVSGTSAIVVNSATGIVSISQLGAVASYMHPSLGYVGPGVSTTGTISGTNGYFSGNVGIGTATPGEFKLSVAEATSITVAKFGATNAMYLMRSYPAIGFGSYWEGSAYRYGDTSKFGAHIFMDSITGVLGFSINTTSGTAGAVVTGNRVMSLTSQTRAGFMTGSPQTLVDVSGTLRLANGGEACDANRLGAVRYTGGDFSFCRNGSSWETLAAVASASDRIVSGTSSVIVNGPASTISFSTAGYTMGWLDGKGVFSLRGRLDLVTGTNVVAVGQGAAQNSSGTDMTAVGLNAANGSSGTFVTAIGSGAARYNQGDEVTALGIGAARNNTISFLTAVGATAATSNTGYLVVAVGKNSAFNNSGSYVTAVGGNSGFNNTGSNVTIIGNSAGQNNTGSNVTALGNAAGQNNTGVNVTGVGVNAAQYNSGTYVTAIGSSAAQNNNADNVIALGREAARDNRAIDVIAVGRWSAFSNSGVAVTAIGGEAGYSNSGAALTALGTQAARYNSGHNVIAVGSQAAQYNTANNVTALGFNAVTGVSNTFSNVTGLGYNAQPTKSGQVMLGDVSLTEVFSYGAGIFNKYVRPGSATTALLPAASSAGAGAIMYDTTVGGLVYSNGSAWTAIAGGSGASADRIISGTSAVVVNSATGIVSISQFGAVASYVHPNLGYVGPGVSATGTVSASKVATNEVFLSKTGGPCSTLADEGRMFRNPTSGRLQVCAVRY